MTKREIVKWLESQRELKWQEAMKDYDLKKAERKAKFEKIIRLDEMTIELSQRLDRVHELCDEFETLMCGNPDVYYHGQYYGGINSRLHSLIGEAVVRQMILNSVSDQSDERKAIEDQWTRDKASIKVNFDKVIAHVRAMSTAKKAIEYLKELGFNVNELQVVTEPETLAIVAPVDTSYLFLKKTEEAGEAQ